VAGKATVWAPDGGKVKMRSIPSKDCNSYWNIPTGATLDIIEEGAEWTHVSSGDHDGYMMTRYLTQNDTKVVDENSVVVDRKRLEAVYDELGDILGLRG